MQRVASAMPVAFMLWVFAFGAIVGSFLNVVIAGVPAGQSIVSPRSRCIACGTAMAWYDNMPVVAWLLLRARCRTCGVRITARCVLVEVACGTLAVALLQHAGLTRAAVGYN